MATISTALRNFKEPTKDQLTHTFFSLPFISPPNGTEKHPNEEVDQMDINAVLSLGLQEEEDSYVRPIPGTVSVAVIYGVVIMAGWKAIYNASLSCFLVSRSKVCTVYNPAVHYQEGRTTECTSGDICIKPLDVAWLKNCASPSF